MSKQYENWCDKYYQKKECDFDIGFIAQNIVNTLTQWTLHDMTITENMSKYEILNQRRRMQKIVEIAERIECISVNANSIYAIYPVDFEERRRLWLEARGYCFQLTVMLTHVVNYVYKDVNVQKYLNMQSEVKGLGTKIKNIMIKDDKRRKEKMKEY